MRAMQHMMPVLHCSCSYMVWRQSKHCIMLAVDTAAMHALGDQALQPAAPLTLTVLLLGGVRAAPRARVWLDAVREQQQANEPDARRPHDVLAQQAGSRTQRTLSAPAAGIEAVLPAAPVS